MVNFEEKKVVIFWSPGHLFLEGIRQWVFTLLPLWGMALSRKRILELCLPKPTVKSCSISPYLLVVSHLGILRRDLRHIKQKSAREHKSHQIHWEAWACPWMRLPSQRTSDRESIRSGRLPVDPAGEAEAVGWSSLLSFHYQLLVSL